MQIDNEKLAGRIKAATDFLRANKKVDYVRFSIGESEGLQVQIVVTRCKDESCDLGFLPLKEENKVLILQS